MCNIGNLNTYTFCIYTYSTYLLLVLIVYNKLLTERLFRLNTFTYAYKLYILYF